jgi:hypothetical protein
MFSHLRSMAVDAAGAALLTTLEEMGIPTVIIKGPAVARFHPVGWPRLYSDIDIVVERADFINSVRASQSRGFEYSPRATPPWHWFYRVCREGVNLHGPVGGNIDIHHHVPPWVIGSKLTPRRIVEGSTEGSLCGQPVRFVSADALLVISILHVLNDLWKGKRGLSSWRDVVVLMTMLGAERSQFALERAGIAWLYELVADALNVAAPGIEFPLASSINPPNLAMRLRIAALGWHGESALSRHKLSWAMRLPIPNALAYVAGSAFPASSYVRDRHGSLRKYWKVSVLETLSTAKGADFRTDRR